MVEAINDNVTGNSGTFITAGPAGSQSTSQQPKTIKDLEAQYNLLGNSDDEFSDDDDDQNKTQYFQVDDAEPPTNYDDPYSTLPGKINLKNIKKDILSSMTFSDGEEQK